MEKIKVSIIIPVYNGSDYLKEAIDSAIGQTYKNKEIIVVNDGSNDNNLTENICLSYGNKIKYIKKENGGVSSALNVGIQNMTGDYFSWLSHDDLYTKDRLEVMVNELEKVDKNVILFSNYEYINEKGKKLFTTHFQTIKDLDEKYEYSLYRALLCGLTLLVPREAFDKCGLFDEKLKCVQDYMLFFKLLSSYRFKFVNSVTAKSRVHSKQVTLTNENMQKENDYLWDYIIDNTSIQLMKKLDGSKYLFYDNLGKFLKYNNISKDAYNYLQDLKNKCDKKKNNNKKIITTFTHFEKIIFVIKKDGLLVLIKKLFRRIAIWMN